MTTLLKLTKINIMKCVFIANAKSGKGKILKYKDWIINNLSQKFSDVIWKETEYAGHATLLAKEYGEKCDYLFFSGGDGTLNEIVNGIFQNKTQPIIGQIPSGTVNDFSKSLKIKKNIKKSLKQLLYSEPKHLDIFRAGEKFGVYICGFGVFTKTSYDTAQNKKKKFGRISYFFNGIKEIKNYKPQTVTYKIGDEEKTNKIALLLIVNSKSVGGFKFNKNAKLDDEMFDFVAFTAKKDKICFSDLLKIAKLFLFGFRAVRKSNRVFVSQLSKISVNSSSQIFLNFDGELASSEKSFELSVVPKALKILVPNK